MARTRAPVHRVAVMAAAGTLAGLGALASAVAPDDTSDAAAVVVLGARTAADALAAPPIRPPLGAVVVELPGMGPAPAPEPPLLPEPCPCLLNQHNPEGLINRLLGNMF
ncbi:hypothetical protein [Actinospica robiniae]|uniref:hypothetical protein n=1 Tax=Actinospica robiniae TaxID=304901 RepID=UPI00040B7A68|nr:hypothetical protein [Actinospica robiniae]